MSETGRPDTAEEAAEHAGGTTVEQVKSSRGSLADFAAASELFRALSSPIRAQLVSLIDEHDGLCVHELVEALEVPQPLVSQHLRILRSTGIVTGTRRAARWSTNSPTSTSRTSSPTPSPTAKNPNCGGFGPANPSAVLTDPLSARFRIRTTALREPSGDARNGEFQRGTPANGEQPRPSWARG